MNDVFISYVRDDSPAVLRLVGDLRRAGVLPWLDRDSLRAGERWAEAVEAAIRRGAFFLACFSRAYVRRERTYMDEELAVARACLADRGLEPGWLVPVLLDDVTPEAVGLTRDPAMGALHAVQMAPDWGDGVRRLLATLSPAHAFGRCLNSLPPVTASVFEGELPLLSLDFGTSTSLLAYRDPQANWEAIRGADGRSFHPSVITFDDRWDYWVGAEAVAAAQRWPTRSVQNIKRVLARRGQIELEHKRFDAVTLASLVLRHMRACAERQLGRAVDLVLAAAPVEHGQDQQQALLDACALAGFRVRRVVNESTAASLLAAVWASTRAHRDDALILVVDVGGGTTDLTLIELAWVTEIDEWQFEVLATIGSPELGGVDYDQAICGYLRQTVVEPLIASGAIWTAADDHRLATVARELKEALSSAGACSATLPDVEVVAGELQSLRLTLSRADLGAAIAPLDAKLDGLFETLAAGRDWPRERTPQAVLLAGLGARHWSIAQLIKHRFPHAQQISRFQDSAVAQGLTIQAEIMDGRRQDHLLLDVVNRHLGFRARPGPGEVHGEPELWLTPADDGDFSWHKLIRRNTTIPTKYGVDVMADGPSTVRLPFGEWSDEGEPRAPLLELEVAIAPGRRTLEVVIDIDANQDVHFSCIDKTERASRQVLATGTVVRRHN